MSGATTAIPAVLARGLRPFFLLAGVYAIVALLLWLGVLAGHCSLPTAFDPLAWHVHVMLFGFAQAAVAGFILTAVPQWTGRPVLSGRPLALLALLWMAGRLAVTFSATLGPVAAAVVDLSFLVVLLLVVVNDILRARMWHGLLLVGVLCVFLAANSLMHLSIVGDLPQLSDLGSRLGLGVVVVLISLIGGRVIPSFTGNWLEARGEARPQGFGL
ncbi:MAG TPA: NnrS family protein, partial [Kiloniellaceae bacterium]